MKISSLLRAATFSLSLASTPANATTTSQAGPTSAGPNASFLIPEGPSASDSCKSSVLSYFKADDLKAINQALGEIRDWFVAHKIAAPKFEEYSAGTKEGLDYLASDPGNVIAAIEIYKNHIDLMRGEAPTTVSAFEKAKGPKLAWLSRVSFDAMMGLDKKIQDNCQNTDQAAPAPSLY